MSIAKYFLPYTLCLGLLWGALDTDAVKAQSATSFGGSVVGLPVPYLEPNPATSTKLSLGKSNLPWIVFSDRNDNYTTTSPGGTLMMEKLTFMQPFYVSEEKDGYLKLLRFSENMVRGLKLKDKKHAESVGWIAKDKLLLWQRSFVDVATRFPNKALTIINDVEPLVAGQYYFDKKDSIYVFDGPDLKNGKAKVALHNYVYVFKKSDDGKQLLIGSADQFVPREAGKYVKGWVSSSVVQNWGHRLYFAPYTFQSPEADVVMEKINKDRIDGLEPYKIDPLIDTANITLLGVPVQTVDESGIVTNYAIDVFNKTNNKLLTINGAELTYPGLINLIKNRSKINIIFVIDGGNAMRNHFASLTNTIQGFENSVETIFNKQNIKYGSVVFRNPSSCGGRTAKMELTEDFRKLTGFLREQSKITSNCDRGNSEQPLFEGIGEATNLVKDVAKQTNLFVIVGSTGNLGGANPSQISSIARRVADVEGRMVMLQAYNSTQTTFNDFIVQSRKLVSSEAYYAAERRKFQLVKGEAFGNQSYDFNLTDSISYYLDFPKNSLIQGGVVFPTRGSSLNNKSFNVAFYRFMDETREDIRSHIHSLDSAFRLTGIENANINPSVAKSLGGKFNQDVGESMPHNAFKFASMLKFSPDLQYQLTKGLDFDLVLNTGEFNEFNSTLSVMTGDNLVKDDNSFRKKLYQNYIEAYKKKWPMYSAGAVDKWTIGKYFSVMLGLPIIHNTFTDMKVEALKNKKEMTLETFEAYIVYLQQVMAMTRSYAQNQGKFFSNGEQYYRVRGSFFNINAPQTTSK